MNERCVKSLVDMAAGQIRDKIDASVTKVLENIFDPSTSDIAKRQLTVTVDFVPLQERSLIHVSVATKEKLCPHKAVNTGLCVTSDGQFGEMVIVELVPEVSGQMDIDGTVTEEPVVLRLVKEA